MHEHYCFGQFISKEITFEYTNEYVCAFILVFSRYKQHKTDFEVIPNERPISLPCRVSRCPCKSYHFVPLNGTQPIRCRCKHFADEHSAAPGFLCKTCKCYLDK